MSVIYRIVLIYILTTILIFFIAGTPAWLLSWKMYDNGWDVDPMNELMTCFKKGYFFIPVYRWITISLLWKVTFIMARHERKHGPYTYYILGKPFLLK